MGSEPLSSFERNLTEFITQMRERFKVPELPFVIARVRDHFGGACGQAAIVRNAKGRVATAVENERRVNPASLRSASLEVQFLSVKWQHVSKVSL